MVSLLRPASESAPQIVFKHEEIGILIWHANVGLWIRVMKIVHSWTIVVDNFKRFSIVPRACVVSVWKDSNHRHNLNRLTYSFKKGEKCQCYRNNLRQVFVIFSPYKESIEIGVENKFMTTWSALYNGNKRKISIIHRTRTLSVQCLWLRPYLLAVLQGIELLD